MTQRPSTRACVEREPSLERSSSEISPPAAGPWAKVRIVWVEMRGRARRRVEESMVQFVFGCLCPSWKILWVIWIVDCRAGVVFDAAQCQRDILL